MALKSAVLLQKERLRSPPRFLGHHLSAHGAKKGLTHRRPTESAAEHNTHAVSALTLIPDYEEAMQTETLLCDHWVMSIHVKPIWLNPHKIILCEISAFIPKS